jgi:hypothetical protein
MKRTLILKWAANINPIFDFTNDFNQNNFKGILYNWLTNG